MKSLVKLLSNNGYIPVNRLLMKLLGINEAILLGELISEYTYFESHGMLTNDDYFYSTTENVEEYTTLNSFQQRKAVNNLVKYGILETERRDIPAKRYFHINVEKLEEILINETFPDV